MDKLRVFTTFTGIGSQEMALRNIGIPHEIVGISEVDRYAITAYDAIHNDQDLKSLIEVPSKEKMLYYMERINIGYNFSTGKSELPKSYDAIKSLYLASVHSNNYGDIRKINAMDLPDFDLFTYSFPCKDISVAGLRAGFEKDTNTQSSLLWECERIIEEKKPKYLLMENVKNLVGKNNINGFKEWIKFLYYLGYNSYYSVLNGKDFGVPQNRERVMMVSILREEGKDNTFRMPDKLPLEKVIKDILEEDVDDKFFLKPEKYLHLLDKFPERDVAYCIDANYHKGISVERFISKRRRELVRVGNLAGEAEHARTRVYSADGISPTIDSGGGGDRQPKMLAHDRVRRLTPLECWRLMGYTDEDFYKAKSAGLSNTKLYERAGRGIIVPMLEELFKEMFSEFYEIG